MSRQDMRKLMEAMATVPATIPEDELGSAMMEVDNLIDQIDAIVTELPLDSETIKRLQRYGYEWYAAVEEALNQ